MSDEQDILLQVTGASKTFGGLKAVDDVTLKLRAGIVTTLVGPNGAGKTTLFNLITGELVADKGEVVWLGQPIIGLPNWKIARLGIGRTFQDLKLFNHMTVEENISTVTERGSWLWQPGGAAARTARGERIDAVLEATGLNNKRHARAIDLAFAERKFLSLARVMASGARLWLLDEPASGLDPGSYARFLSLLRNSVAGGVTICIIEHNLDIVQGISDRIAFLDQGRLLAEGDPKTILSDPALAAIYFGERAAWSTAPVLKAENLRAGYGGKPVLLDVAIELKPAEVLCVIGHNGAGKSTLMRTLFGLVAPEAGTVLVDGARLSQHAPRVLASHGIAMVPEGRGIFPGLTVKENFALGMWSAGVPAAQRAERVEWVLSVLPPVRNFYDKRAGLLSGGQQQMVSIGRAILAQPRCLLMDEPSIGLAPKLFQDLMRPIRELQQQRGMSILLIEQNVREALKVSDRVVVMKAGAIILEALPGELKDNARLMELY